MEKSVKTREYTTEKLLVDSFCGVLKTKKSPWGRLRHTTEFSYGRGRTDVVAVDKDGQVIAFEMKLNKWAKAMQQAYKNTCFANLSYAVFPANIAKNAEKAIKEFQRRSIGICYIKKNEIVVTLPATHLKPIQPWLSQSALARISEDMS